MTTEVLWISAAEISALNIPMQDIMERVEAGFASVGRGETEMPAKIGIHPRENCFIHAMPCYVGGEDLAGIKCISGYPPNPAKGHPYITGLMVLCDPATGLPLAVMDAAWITAWRTGAASGVYARHFGNQDSASVALIGTGVQARTNLLAMKEVFPRLDTVFCQDISDEAMARFINDMQPLLPKAEFVACPDIPAAVGDADVLITCTPIVEAPERPVARSMIKPDCLAIAVDYDAALNADVFAGGHFTCDNFNQYTWTREQGGYFRNGYPGPADIDADMGEICSGAKEGLRAGQRGAVLMGIASHDVMTAALVHEKALAAGIGTEVKL
ncbi:ornithine cyclodeaminase family protein [Pseudodesulfovibrio cashew]|uniref:Ornithine cyclodeaminase family protein n=1 Tax=Pseudodesulfovibrio cashew TaxID=2678688 RepID=A0A6I6JK92_9BACT|nr:ornithine cyclodeaminase family protein [Pseudodesulfovibrio cashew]QGY41400.1 ornithine cyclodeaminase family protein [Pseudodesulfovibrio cashew]